jgi:hypothetical protein
MRYLHNICTVGAAHRPPEPEPNRKPISSTIGAAHRYPEPGPNQKPIPSAVSNPHSKAFCIALGYPHADTHGESHPAAHSFSFSWAVCFLGYAL